MLQVIYPTFFFFQSGGTGVQDSVVNQLLAKVSKFHLYYHERGGVHGSSGPGSSSGRRHCVVFLGKTLLSQGLSPPRCINGYQRT